MITNLTKLYENGDLSGASADIIYLPIVAPGTLKSVDVLTDAATAGSVVFALYLNGVEQVVAAVTITTGNKIGSVASLSIALVKGDEIVLRRVSGSISSPVTLNLSVDDGISGGSGGSIPQNSQSADYTLVIGDANKHIYHPDGDNNARTFTIPANASVAFAIGDTITVINDKNTVTIAITSDTLVLAGSGATGTRTLTQYGTATAVKVTSTRWIISGVNLS